MSAQSWVPRNSIQQNVQVTPTISSSPAYSTGDQVGGIMTLPLVVRPDPNGTGLGTASLTEVTILDASIQNAAFDIWFFKTSPTVTSVDNGAFSMSDANQALQCIGYVSVGSSYSASALNSTSSTTNLNKSIYASVGSTIYAIAIVRGTPTYGTTTSLQFQFNFLVD